MTDDAQKGGPMDTMTAALAAEDTANRWGVATAKLQKVGQWTDVATKLAAEHMAKPTPSRRELRRGRRIAAAAEELGVAKQVAAQMATAKLAATATATATHPVATTTTGHSGWVRYIAPTAALGTAAVMQVAVMTDTFGTRMATAMAKQPDTWMAAHTWVGYVAGLVLGLAVAACMEGGAAHVMRLYEKHLLAGDSTWMDRLKMFAYVGGSAWLIHWWLDKHQLPGEVAYVLAAMTGSAILLWSAESRWKNREQLRRDGKLDEALPRLPLAAKLWHPLRWLQTQFLISWDTVATTAEARARYADMVAARRAAKSDGAAAEQDAAVATRVAAEVAKLVATQTGTVEGPAWVDPWDRAVDADLVDPDADLAAWAATPDGRAVVATAKQRVATAKRTATYDVATVKAAIRRGLDELTADMGRAELDAAKRAIDEATMATAGVSLRQARRLRSEVSGEPVSAPPANEREGSTR